MDIDAVVLSNNRLSEDYNVIAIAAPEIATQSRPGQFVMVKCGLNSEPLLRRPFSIFEVLRNSNKTISGLSLLNKAVGVVTRTLFTLEPGQRLRCLGPLGQPFSVVSPPNEAWMVAGGVGLAPFLTLAEALQQRSTATTLFYGGRSSSDLYYLDRFEQLGVRLFLTTEDDSRGECGYVTAPLTRELEKTAAWQPVTLYACGPTRMMLTVARLAQEHRRVSEVSLEPVMGCGLGGCYSCVVPVRAKDGSTHLVRSCLNGPVFSGDDIAWNELT
jgi:dihydroorotate dehydrogenase electron transfer subunit